MVEKLESVSMYTGLGEKFGEDELEEMNRALEELEINCHVSEKIDADGFTLVFTKTEV